MGKIERFEDIQAWQRARVLTQRIYEVTGGGTFTKDFSLKDQIRRASISIMLRNENLITSAFEAMSFRSRRRRNP